MVVQFRLKQRSKQIQTNCTFDLPSIRYILSFSVCSIQYIRADNRLNTASAPVAPFKQNFINIYQTSATNGNWSVTKAERAVYFEF